MNSSLTKAQNEGILLVETPSEKVTSASEQVQDYLAKQSQYQKDLATYQAYQKEKAIMTNR